MVETYLFSKPKNTAMKILTLLPKKIKKMYGIKKEKKSIHIYKPAFVNIDINEKFEMRENDITISLYNGICEVAIWKNSFHLHITIF